jgi:bifunctional UDP-N-acetylglucosamine pyrophosphorylase/glucosamine-1-phosphate N-acetyltransferase
MIGKDAVIGPSCLIKGKTKIEENSVIGPFCQITDSVIGEGSRINSSVIECSNIGKNSNIGPYSYIKQGAVIVQLYKDNKKDTA